MIRQTDTAPAPTEAWKTPRHLIETEVKLADAPDLHHGGNRYIPYNVTFHFRRTGNGPWSAAITIYATKRYPSGGTALTGSCLNPDQLDDMPDWLADIIARATPEN